MNDTQRVRVADALRRTQRKHKVKNSEYLDRGLLPVVDQGANFIAGYIDDLTRAYDGELPVVVFGDHTCRVKFVDFPFAVGADGTQILQPVEGWDSRYFYYCISALDMSHFGYQRHFKYLKEELIPFRPLVSQRKIAAILAAHDELIENNLRRIEVLEQMAQAIYLEWFVEFRYPGHEHVQFVDSQLGPIPEGWKYGPLVDVVGTQYGYTASTEDEEVGPKFLRGMDFNKQPWIDWSEVPFCEIEESEYKKYRLNKGDIVVIRMADPGKPAIVEQDVDAVFASYLVRISPNREMVEPYWLFYYLLSHPYQQYIAGAATGTTRKSASAAVLTGPTVVLPRQTIQAQFAQIVLPIRSLLNRLLKQNATLRATRDLLLPKLISGEIDVSDLDIDTSWLAA